MTVNGWKGWLLRGGISIGLLAYLVQRGGGISALVHQVQGLPLWMLAVAWALYSVAILLAAVKWGVLLRAQGVRVPWRVLAVYTFMGAFFNNVLPANVGGDVVRGYGLAQHTGRRTDAAVSVVMDRLVGLVAFLAMAAGAAAWLLWMDARGAMPLDATARENVQRIGVVVWGTLGVLLAGMGLLLSRRAKRRLERVLSRLRAGRWVLPAFQRVAAALNAYRHAYGSLVTGMGMSWAVLLVTSLEIWLLARALAARPLPFLHVLLVNPLVAFALLVPLSLGGLGVGQTAYVFFFGLLGVPAPVALALSLVQQTVIYLASIPGALLWWRYRPADVRREQRVVPHQV